MERPKNSFRKFFSTRRKNEFVGSKDDLFEMKRSMSVFDRLKQFSRRKDRSKDTENNIRFERIFKTKDNSESLMYNVFLYSDVFVPPELRPKVVFRYRKLDTQNEARINSEFHCSPFCWLKVHKSLSGISDISGCPC